MNAPPRTMLTYWEQYGMTCWNGLSAAQQDRLIEWGNLPLFSKPEGDGCKRPAQVFIETEDDKSPGPRAYCRACAIRYLGGKLKTIAEVTDELRESLSTIRPVLSSRSDSGENLEVHHE